MHPVRSFFGLNTVSMTELYDTVYPPRRPIVNDLLYSGTYLFVGAPKVDTVFSPKLFDFFAACRLICLSEFVIILVLVL